MNICRTLLSISILIITSFVLQAQKEKKASHDLSDGQKALNIGDNVPAIAWQSIPKKKSTELIILEFWTTGCISCIEAFTHMEDLQNQFPEKLQVVFVNPWESAELIKTRMDRINIRRKNKGMPAFPSPENMSFISGDTIFRHLFPTVSVPHHVWIDGAGKVLFITQGYNATSNHVKKVLAGEPVVMSLRKDLVTEGFSARNGIVKSSHPTIIPVQYSFFANYNPGYESSSSIIEDTVAGYIKQVELNSEIIELYKKAYGYDKRFLLETKNKNRFRVPDWLYEGDILDDWMRNNVFSYELYVPLERKELMSQYMQADLKRFFGAEKGIEGVLKKRKLYSLVLVKTNAKLSSKKAAVKNGNILEPIIRFTDFKSTSNYLKENLEDMYKGRPFIDETGIDSSLTLDIELTGDLKNVENVREQLRQYGLDIVEAEREVEVLVIRDKKRNKQ